MGITHFTSLGPNFLRQLDWTVSPGLSSLKIHKALLVYNFTSSFPHFPHSCTALQVICCGGYWEYKEQDVAWLMKISMSSFVTTLSYQGHEDAHCQMGFCKCIKIFFHHKFQQLDPWRYCTSSFHFLDEIKQGCYDQQVVLLENIKLMFIVWGKKSLSEQPGYTALWVRLKLSL